MIEVKEIQITSLYVSLWFFQKGLNNLKCTVSCVLVSKEQPKDSKKESGDAVQEEARQSKPNTKKRGLTGVSEKPTKGSGLVAAKKRKVGEILEKKRKKKKIRVMQWIPSFSWEKNFLDELVLFICT